MQCSIFRENRAFTCTSQSGTLSIRCNQICKRIIQMVCDNTMNEIIFKGLITMLPAICLQPLQAETGLSVDPPGASLTGSGPAVPEIHIDEGPLSLQQQQEAAAIHAIEQYNEEIHRLEADDGAYHSGLSEELTGLGLAYSALGNHEEALKAYDRALQINRINQGLQNMNQIPLLERIIEENTALNNLQELTANHDYLLWVYLRNHDNYDPQLLPVFSRIANWHLDAYDRVPRPDAVAHLIKAANLFHRSIEIIEQSNGADDPAVISALYGIANANFKFVEPFGFIPNIDAFFSGTTTPLLPSNFERNIEGDSFARNRYSATPYNQDRVTQILQNQENSIGLIRDSYKSGRNALQRIIDIHNNNPELPRVSLAYALTHLGDWYLRFNKRNSAISSYEQAYQLLTENEHDPQSIERLFGRPQSLDALGIPENIIRTMTAEDTAMQEASSADSDTEMVRLNDLDLANTQFILVEFDVTEFGSVRNLEIIAANPDDSVSFRRMAKNKISSTPFRPRLEDGKPVKTDDVKILYRFN